jgi:2-iminobutanoate/2-iminopropanoate deaminase
MNERSIVKTDRAPGAIGPYSQAVRAGGLVFTAGQIGADPESGALLDGVAAQAERSLANLRAVLAAAGTDFERLVKVTIFLADMGDFDAVNEVYMATLPEPYPARSTVAVRGLPKGALVEIEMVALAGDGASG